MSADKEGKAPRKVLPSILPLLLSDELPKVVVDRRQAEHGNSAVARKLRDFSPGFKVLRLQISGLKTGNQQPDPSSETRESAAGRATVIVPVSMLNEPPELPVEVLLHLHGHNVGYRTRATPLTESQEPGIDPGAMARGTQRDRTVDKIEQQIGDSGRPMIAVLPQGTSRSQFGVNGLDSNTFIEEALAKVAEKLGWSHRPATGSVVLSAHSGGGGRVAEMLPVEGKSLKGSPPAGMKELVLLDAINGVNELSRVTRWVMEQMERDLVWLQWNSDHLESSMRLRAVYTPGYATRYLQLKKSIDDWLMEKQRSGLPEPVVKQLRKNYSVMPAGHRYHTPIVGRDDALLKAIQDLP